MIKNKYSPAHVKNPTSMEHVVLLKPGQMLYLHLNKESYFNPKIETSTPYLNVFKCSTIESEEDQEFLIIQDDQVSEWADFSRSYLGDIWVDSDFYMCRLIIMLECNNEDRRNITTVVNPEHTDIRMQGHGILEVILCDETFEDQDDWRFEWSPDFMNLKLELLKKQSVNLNAWNSFYKTLYEKNKSFDTFLILPRFCFPENRLCRQHHFWFAFKENIGDFIHLRHGIKQIGNLKFFGSKDGKDSESEKRDFFMSLSVNLDKVDKFKMYRNQLIELENKNIRPSLVDSFKKKSSSNNFFSYNYSSKSSNTLNEVTLTLVESNSLHDNCNTLPMIYEKQEFEIIDPKNDDGSCDKNGVCYDPTKGYLDDSIYSWY